MKRNYAAKRLQQLQESVIRSITRYAAEKGAVLLAQGFPDFDPPKEVLAAAEKAMREGKNQYGMTWGQPRPSSLRFWGQLILEIKSSSSNPRTRTIMPGSHLRAVFRSGSRCGLRIFGSIPRNSPELSKVAPAPFCSTHLTILPGASSPKRN